MRQELDDLLCQRYPTLFAERHLSPQLTAMCWGFACGDGWFALIDSFCMEVLSLYADEPSIPIVIKQVKSKFKTLRIYCTGNDLRVRAMSQLVRTLSEHIDEDNGNLSSVDQYLDTRFFISDHACPLFKSRSSYADARYASKGSHHFGYKQNQVEKKGDQAMANYKDGVIRDGSSIGTGTALGNIKDGVIRNGSSTGSGKPLGNVKDGIIRDGSAKGSGSALFNVKGDDVKNGSSLGSGSAIGKIGNFGIKGMERELDAEIVAAYHFLVKKIV